MDELDKLNGLAVVPVNGIDTDNQLFYSDIWFHLIDGEIHAYGLSPDKTTPFHVFTYVVTNIHSMVGPDMKTSYSVTYNHPEYGDDQTMIVRPAGGCGCSDPRKNVKDLARMQAIAERGAAKQSRQNSSGTMLETEEQAQARRAAAARRSQITRQNRAAAIQEAIAKQDERKAAAAKARPWQDKG